MRNKDTHRTQFTGGHLVLLKILDKLGISCDSEVEFDPYRVDIYLNRYHLAIEYDGAHNMKSYDRRRDEYLMNTFSLPVLRIKEWNSKDEIKSRILKFIGDNGKSVNSRKDSIWR